MVVDGFLKYDLLRIKKHIWNILLESFIYKGSWRSMDIAAASYIMCMEKAEGRGFNIIRTSRFLNISPRACFFNNLDFYY